MTTKASALLACLKREGWYMHKRLAVEVGTTVMCGGCDDECSALEWYRHPVSGETRMFDVCDGCGWSVEDKPEPVSNDEEARIRMLAGLYARRRDPCFTCHVLLENLQLSGDDADLWRLRLHVRSPQHGDEEREDRYAALVAEGMGGYDAWRFVYEDDEEPEAEDPS